MSSYILRRITVFPFSFLALSPLAACVQLFLDCIFFLGATSAKSIPLSWARVQLKSGLHRYTSIRRFISVVWCSKTTEMIIRLGRLTPGYFRLLQSQVAGEVQAPSCDRSANQIAMMLAIMGLSLSYYSAKQMTEKVRRVPAP